MATIERSEQLDGLRAVAIFAICYDHWVPAGWSYGLPYEVGLFFFLTMSGYLITASLLRSRARAEAQVQAGTSWQWQAYRDFQWNRSLRIAVPYWVALGFGLVIGCVDLWQNFAWYALFLTNIHLARLEGWAHGTSHFWSIAIQQQFYLLWPLVVWLAPKRTLPWLFLGFAALAPWSRLLEPALAHWFARPGKLSWAACDYFGLGALMAWAVARGLKLASAWWTVLAVVGCAGYLVMKSGWFVSPGLIVVQQTFLSLGLCGIIARACVGFPQALGALLALRPLVRAGQLSYGIYLYHNLVPIAVGRLMPFLWHPQWLEAWWLVLVRLIVFALATWGLVWLSWRYIEAPLQRQRRVPAAT